MSSARWRSQSISIPASNRASVISAALSPSMRRLPFTSAAALSAAPASATKSDPAPLTVHAFVPSWYASKRTPASSGAMKTLSAGTLTRTPNTLPESPASSSRVASERQRIVQRAFERRQCSHVQRGNAHMPALKPRWIATMPPVMLW
jgi:hypothetical protein